MKAYGKFWIPPTALGISAAVFFPRLYAHEPKEVASKLVRACDLPIYDNPETKGHREYIEEHVSSVREQISKARRAVWDVIDSAQETTDSVINKYETGKAHTRQTIEYLRDEANILPRAAFITGGAITGVLLGIRRGFFKKLIYSGVGVMVTTSICYPKQSKRVATAGYAYAKLKSLELYELVSNKKVTDSPPPPSPSATSPATDPKDHEIPKGFYDSFTKKVEAAKKLAREEKESPVIMSEQADIPSKPALSPKVMDKGMSKAEDQDMYTTRNRT